MPGSWRGTSPRATGIPHPLDSGFRRSDETRPQGRPTPRDWRFPLHPRSGLKPYPTARLRFVGMPVGTARLAGALGWGPAPGATGFTLTPYRGTGQALYPLQSSPIEGEEATGVQIRHIGNNKIGPMGFQRKPKPDRSPGHGLGRPAERLGRSAWRPLSRSGGRCPTRLHAVRASWQRRRWCRSRGTGRGRYRRRS